MMGNYYVWFLVGKGVVTPLTYSVQHKDFMGWKDPEVLVHKDNQFVSVKDLELSPVHLPCALFPQGFQLELLFLPF